MYKLREALKLYECWKNNVSCGPNFVELLISSRCNSRCVMCNVWKLLLHNPEIVEKEVTLEQYQELFKELSAMGVKSIVLSGGEPTMRRDIIDIIREARVQGIGSSMITNGSLINEEMAKDLVFSGLDVIHFSIDAPIPEVHDRIRGVRGLWKKATDGIKLIYRMRSEMHIEKPKIIVNYVINELNFQLIFEMLELQRELNYDHIVFSPVIDKVKQNENLLLLTKNSLEKLLKTKLDARLANDIRNFYEYNDTTLGYYAKIFNKELLCLAPYHFATIDPFGNVYPCCYAVPFQNLGDDLDLTRCYWGSNDLDLNMGNITKTSFRQIWTGDKYNQLRKTLKSVPLPFEMCKWCMLEQADRALFTGLFKDKRILLRLIGREVQKYLHRLSQV